MEIKDELDIGHKITQVKDFIKNLDEQTIDYLNFKDWQNKIENVLVGLNQAIEDMLNESLANDKKVKEFLSHPEIKVSDWNDDPFYQILEVQRRAYLLLVDAVLPYQTLVIEILKIFSMKLISAIDDVKQVGEEKQRASVLKDIYEDLHKAVKESYSTATENQKSIYENTINSMRETMEVYKDQVLTTLDKQQKNFVDGVKSIVSELKYGSNDALEKINELENKIKDLESKVNEISEQKQAKVMEEEKELISDRTKSDDLIYIKNKKFSVNWDKVDFPPSITNREWEKFKDIINNRIEHADSRAKIARFISEPTIQVIMRESEIDNYDFVKNFCKRVYDACLEKLDLI